MAPVIEEIIRTQRQVERRLTEYRSALEGFRAPISTANVSNPPTGLELTVAFGGTPDYWGGGFIGIVDDGDAHVNVWLCATVRGTWWYVPLAQASTAT